MHRRTAHLAEGGSGSGQVGRTDSGQLGWWVTNSIRANPCLTRFSVHVPGCTMTGMHRFRLSEVEPHAVASRLVSRRLTRIGARSRIVVTPQRRRRSGNAAHGISGRRAMQRYPAGTMRLPICSSRSTRPIGEATDPGTVSESLANLVHSACTRGQGAKADTSPLPLAPVVAGFLSVNVAKIGAIGSIPHRHHCRTDRRGALVGRQRARIET